jgi:hypothetical protein
MPKLVGGPKQCRRTSRRGPSCFGQKPVGSDAPTAFSCALDCLTHLKHRHLDARSRSCVAHDLADRVGCDGGAHAVRGESPHCPVGPPCRGDRRYSGSAQDVDLYSGLDARFSDGTWCAYGSGCDHSVVTALSYICSWLGRGDERPLHGRRRPRRLFVAPSFLEGSP